MTKTPSTRALRELKDRGATFSIHLFDYDRFPGAEGAASAIGVDLNHTAKTIEFTTSDSEPVIVVMHGDRVVSTKKLARHLGVKSVRPATAEEAHKSTGYVFGGTSPLGLRTPVPVLIESTLLDLERVYVNAGSRGFLVGIDPMELQALAGAELAEVSVD